MNGRDVFGVGSLILVAAIVPLALSGCGGSHECDGATRGCVKVTNNVLADYTVHVQGGGSVVVPGGTSSSPGVAWIMGDSTVGSQTTFYISQFNPGIDTCTVGASTWATPDKPPAVNIYTAFGPTALRCYNW